MITFPNDPSMPFIEPSEFGTSSTGFTKREEIAIRNMHSLLANQLVDPFGDIDQIALIAVEAADALITALNHKNEQKAF